MFKKSIANEKNDWGTIYLSTKNSTDFILLVHEKNSNHYIKCICGMTQDQIKEGEGGEARGG